MNTYRAIKNKHGDFEVVNDKGRVKGGYFSRMEDYASTEAKELARKLNAKDDELPWEEQTSQMGY